LKGVNRSPGLWMGAVLAFIFFLLLSWGLRTGGDWNLLDETVVEITTPFQSFIYWSVGGLKRFWHHYFYLVGAHDENLSLKKENEDLRRELGIHRELISGCERIEELTAFRKALDQPTIPASVTGVDPSGLFKSIIIDKGKNKGVGLDMAVISARGAVGRVVSVSPNYAKVLLIIDQNSSVDCFVQRSRERGMVKGFSEKECRLDYVPAAGDIIVEDMVVTSGLDGIFPKGIPIGRVSAIEESESGLFMNIRIKPEVSFSSIEEVLVVLGGGARSSTPE